MRYREYAPSNLVGRYVECFWSLESSTDEPGTQQRIAPDGRAEIILHLGEPPSMAAGSTVTKQGTKFLAGQLTRPLVLFPTSSLSVVGIRLRPGAAASWLGAPMNEFTDQTPTIHDLPRPLQTALDCFDSDIPEQAIKALDRALDDCAQTSRPSERMERAVALVLESRGAIKMDRLAFEVNLSRRQVERNFLREVGLSPKTFARIIRFQNVFQAYEAERDWVSVAHECGYYDQAHLIQDFRELTGETPTKLLSRESDLATFFLQMSHSSKTKPGRIH